MSTIPRSNSDEHIHERLTPRAPFHGMVASGTLLAISGVALVIIFAINPAAAGSFASVWGGIGGISLIVLASSAALNYHARQKLLRREREEAQQPPPVSEQVDAEQRSERSSVSHLGEQIPIKGEEVTDIIEGEEVTDTEESAAISASSALDTFRNDLIPNLMEAFQKATLAMIQAHSHCTGSQQTNFQDIEQAFEQTQELIQSSLDNSELYLTELVHYFGRGPNKPSTGLRRLVIAHNSGDSEKLEEAQKQYAAIERGNNLSDVAELLRSSVSDTAILLQFPEIMKKHFCIDDEILQEIGNNLLQQIFSRLKGNSNICRALKTLRRTAPRQNCSKKQMEAFTKAVEIFMKLAFKEAKIPKNEIEEMREQLVEHMIANRGMQRIKNILGTMARNIRLLPSMFQNNVDIQELFPQIDETFLLSESRDCLHKDTEQRQEELIKLQSQINLTRPEEKKVALLVETETAQEIVSTCYRANQGNYRKEELIKIAARQSVQDLATYWEIEILVVPISISDHPFKRIRKTLNRIPNAALRLLYNAFKKFLPGIVKPGLFEMLPTLGESEQCTLNNCVDTLLNCFMQPIYDGSINNGSPFRQHFKSIIVEEGNQLANDLLSLISQENNELTFEQIRDTWVNGIDAVEKRFQALYAQ